MKNQVHVFEAAGLGKAPFAFAGLEDTGEDAGPDGLVRRSVGGIDHLTKPGGSCDLCGHYIKIFCWVKSADGKRFKVGSDCIAKIGDKGLKKVVDDHIRYNRNEKRRVNEKKKIDNAIELLSDENIRQALAAQPHPLAWRAEKGENKLDWAEWMMSCAGNSGKLQVARVINEQRRKK